MKTQTFYSVSTNNEWTTKSASISFYENKGAVVKPSRLYGDYNVYINGSLVAYLFEKQADQKAFLKSEGLI